MGELTTSHLPVGYKSEELIQLIKLKAHETVKITMGLISKDRPPNLIRLEQYISYV